MAQRENDFTKVANLTQFPVHFFVYKLVQHFCGNWEHLSLPWLAIKNNFRFDAFSPDAGGNVVSGNKSEWLMCSNSEWGNQLTAENYQIEGDN